jgi:5,5'-dehydrodivanillate O-demethylase
VDFTDFSHTGPGTLAGRYLRRFWQPVYRSQDLPPGRAVPIKVMGEEFTLYRGEALDAPVSTRPEPHLVANRCAHRGTQLSTGWVEGDCIRCFYHGWKYDGSGQCVEQPAEDAGFASKVRIGSYPVREYLGLVFVYLGDEAAGDATGAAVPDLPRYPFMEQLPEEGCVRWVHVDKQPYRYNYRNGLENSVDPVHVAFVHRNSEYRGLVGCPTVSAEETDYGMILHARRPDGGTRITQLQMPNILYIKQGPRYPQEVGWRDFLLWRVPVDDESFRGYRVIAARAPQEAAEAIVANEERLMAEDPAPELGEAVLAGKMHSDEITDLRLAVTVQDWVAQRGQGVIYQRQAERLGRSDTGVILIRKLYERELRKLHAGEPLKRWATVTPAATVGLESS